MSIKKKSSFSARIRLAPIYIIFFFRGGGAGEAEAEEVHITYCMQLKNEQPSWKYFCKRSLDAAKSDVAFRETIIHNAVLFQGYK